VIYSRKESETIRWEGRKEGVVILEEYWGGWGWFWGSFKER
jgi:hypothetical protein